MANTTVIKKYTAEPTLELFHNDVDSLVRYVEGPFGSGKSTGCLMELLMQSMQQQPDENNVRRTRWAIIRQTYPELKSTTIKTFEHWIPPSVAPVVYGIPYSAKMRRQLSDGTTCDIEFVFLALETEEDVKKLLSFELTGAYINEARELPEAIVDNIIGRIGRYPETKQDDNGKVIFGPTRKMLIMDSNPPRTTHWLYTRFETGKTPEGWKKYKQPPAVFYNTETEKYEISPDAENLSHLDPNYYKDQLSGSEDFIRVNLAGEYGMSRRGKPVLSKFSEAKHKSKEILQPIRGFPIIIGMDFGLTPASVIGQVTGQGARIYDELPASDEMLEDYLDEYVLPLIQKRYGGYSIILCGDPAGKNRSRLDKRTDFDVVRTRRIKGVPATTNDPIQRIAAVTWFLTRDQGMQISPNCTHLIEACSGGYVLKEAKNANGMSLDTPLKNEYSHISDALQYFCLYGRFGTRPGQQVKQEDRKPHLYA